MSWGIRMFSGHDHFDIQAKPDRSVYAISSDNEDDIGAASAASGTASGLVSELISIIGGNLVRADLATATTQGSRIEIEPSGATVAVPAIDASDPAVVTLSLTDIKVKAVELALALQTAVSAETVGSDWCAAFANGVLYMRPEPFTQSSGDAAHYFFVQRR